MSSRRKQNLVPKVCADSEALDQSTASSHLEPSTSRTSARGKFAVFRFNSPEKHADFVPSCWLRERGCAYPLHLNQEKLLKAKKACFSPKDDWPVLEGSTIIENVTYDVARGKAKKDGNKIKSLHGEAPENLLHLDTTDAESLGAGKRQHKRPRWRESYVSTSEEEDKSLYSNLQPFPPTPNISSSSSKKVEKENPKSVHEPSTPKISVSVSSSKPKDESKNKKESQEKGKKEVKIPTTTHKVIKHTSYKSDVSPSKHSTASRHSPSAAKKHTSKSSRSSHKTSRSRSRTSSVSHVSSRHSSKRSSSRLSTPRHQIRQRNSSSHYKRRSTSRPRSLEARNSRHNETPAREFARPHESRYRSFDEFSYSSPRRTDIHYQTSHSVDLTRERREKKYNRLQEHERHHEENKYYRYHPYNNRSDSDHGGRGDSFATRYTRHDMYSPTKPHHYRISHHDSKSQNFPNYETTLEKTTLKITPTKNRERNRFMHESNYDTNETIGSLKKRTSDVMLKHFGISSGYRMTQPEFQQATMKGICTVIAYAEDSFLEITSALPMRDMLPTTQVAQTSKSSPLNKEESLHERFPLFTLSQIKQLDKEMQVKSFYNKVEYFLREQIDVKARKHDNVRDTTMKVLQIIVSNRLSKILSFDGQSKQKKIGFSQFLLANLLKVVVQHRSSKYLEADIRSAAIDWFRRSANRKDELMPEDRTPSPTAPEDPPNHGDSEVIVVESSDGSEAEKSSAENSADGSEYSNKQDI